MSEPTNDLSGMCAVATRLREPLGHKFDEYKESELRAMIECAKVQWDEAWPGEHFTLTIGKWELSPAYDVKDPETGEIFHEPESYRCLFTLHKKVT